MTHHQDAPEGALASPVDHAWSEAVVLELRLLGVSGSRVGEILAEVESHCAESGQGAREAFGDPAAYARSLGERRELPIGELVRAVGPTVLQVVGLILVGWALPAILDGAAAALTTGQVASGVLVLAAIGAVVLAADAVLRVVVRHPVVATIGVVAFLVAAVALLVALDGVLAVVPSAAVAGAGVVALAAGTVWHLVARARHGSGDDPVTTPFGAQVGPSGRLARILGAATPWLVPAAAVVSMGLTFALR